MLFFLNGDNTRKRGQIFNIQNTFDICDEIRMEIQTENFFGSQISTRLQYHQGCGNTEMLCLSLGKLSEKRYLPGQNPTFSTIG
jgi:hypothetical protein